MMNKQAPILTVCILTVSSLTSIAWSFSTVPSLSLPKETKEGKLLLPRTQELRILQRRSINRIDGLSTEEWCSQSRSSSRRRSVHLLSAPLTEFTDVDEAQFSPLMSDISMLTEMLSEVVERENSAVHNLYKKLLQHGLNRAADPNDDTSLQQMIQCASDLNPSDALGVMRTFSLALNLVNAAEVHHRLRTMKEFELTAGKNSHVGPLPMTEDSMRGTIDAIVDSKEGTEDLIFQKLMEQKIEIVLTAHPTEVNRRTLLRKYRQVTEILGYLERADLHPYERSEALLSLRRIIASLWGCDEIRRRKPTPQMEALGGIAIIESVLWEALPSYLRKLDAQCRISLGRRLPVDLVPIKFASWIGGDRDGNPNVTPAVTKEVVIHQRLRAAQLYLEDMSKLYNELAISSRFSNEMEFLAMSVTQSFDKHEKYRRVIGHLRRRLVKTVKVCERDLHQLTSLDSLLITEATTYASDSEASWSDVEPIYDASELMEPLRIMYNSLVQTGFELVADGLLVDIIRRVSAFGMTLVPLDIREESTRHTNVLDAITRYLGLGSYGEWDESARVSFLQSELVNKRPLFRIRELDSLGFDDVVVKTLRTFEVASTIGSAPLGAYVISQAQTASDVLAVMLLQKQFGMTSTNAKMMRIVPLFETLDDLTNAASVLDVLFSIPAYVGAIRGKQEVMVGYSDSAKDAGRLAALWAQYKSQEEMAQVAKKYGIELTFFHGKGGTVGRGGNPVLYNAIQSHPPNTINGRFRVTEQGEMITQNFGSPDIAERTLDIYVAAVLREGFTKHVEPTESWRLQMQRLSDVSCAGYRQLVREDPRFVPYFRQATPEVELGYLNIGSRPAKRNPKGGIESLRAIPWTFAWTQTRTHLSAWLGVGDGLNPTDDSNRAELREMYERWPWFRENIDLVAMILSKTDFSISENYDDQLVDKTNADIQKLGSEVREKLVETRKGVLEVSGSTDFAGPHVQLLRASTQIRNPYIDPINVVQAELLKRLRKFDMNDDGSGLTPADMEAKEVMQDALQVSIKGVSQGMRNSG